MLEETEPGVELEHGCPVTDFWHHDTSIAADPFPTFAGLRRLAGLVHSRANDGFWIATDYRTCHAVAHDPEGFPSGTGVSYPHFANLRPMIPIECDPPEHAKYRGLLNAGLSAARVQRMSDSIRSDAHGLIDGFAGTGSCDLMREFAMPFTASVLGRVLGVKAEEVDQFQQCVIDFIHMPADDPQAGALAAAAMYEFWEDFFEQRAASGERRDDIVDTLVHTPVGDRLLTLDEQCDIAILLLAAGIETTASALGNGIVLLHDFPDARQRIIENRSLIPAAIEEILRIAPPVMGMARKAAHERDVNGCPVPKDSWMLMLFASANRDSEEFPAADSFDVERQPNRHLSFGTGIHRCAGSHLARVELEIAFNVLLDRIPDFRVEDRDGLVWAFGQTRHLLRLPLVFTANASEGATADGC